MRSAIKMIKWTGWERAKQKKKIFMWVNEEGRRHGGRLAADARSPFILDGLHLQM